MKINKSLYLEADPGSIDEAIANDLAQTGMKSRGKGQDYLRDRLRTGAVLHTLLGDMLARSLQQLHELDEARRWEVLLSTIHHARTVMAQSEPAIVGSAEQQLKETLKQELLQELQARAEPQSQPQPQPQPDMAAPANNPPPAKRRNRLAQMPIT